MLGRGMPCLAWTKAWPLQGLGTARQTILIAQACMSSHDTPPFDPRDPPSPPASGRLSIFTPLTHWITLDEPYRILFRELFAHIILLPPLLLMSVALRAVSDYLGTPRNFFEHTAHFLIQCMSLALVFLAFLTVVMTLLEAIVRIGQESTAGQYLLKHGPRAFQSLCVRTFAALRSLRTRSYTALQSLRTHSLNVLRALRRRRK